MSEVTKSPQGQPDADAERLQNLGYTQELSRVLSLFDNFSVAFSYLSPMVGVYSLFVLGLGSAGPRYLWLMPLVVLGMLMVALVFGELGSHYPVAGAIYQYGKYSVSAGYGWWVGWLYGMALLVTVASVDTGVVGYVTALSDQWFGTKMDPTNSTTILVITIVLILIQTTMNAVGAKLMSRVTALGVYVETIGTFGVAIALAVVGFHHGFGFLFDTAGAQYAATNPLGMNFHGNWLTGAALVAILAHVYIFYGFESAGDIAEETKDASRQVPRAMRSALVYGGVASFVLVAGLILATPSSAKGYAAVFSGGGVPGILSELPQWLQDFFLVMVIIAFFSCGTAVQGAGARLAFSFARDGAVPAHKWVGHISPRFHTPVNAIIIGAIVPIAFSLMVNINPSSDVKILWFTYPKGINALFVLVSFGVSGIYLSFMLTVIGSMIARARGWVPEGAFRLGRWGWLVSWLALAYLVVMLINIVAPTGLSSPRAFFNYDWITFVVMVGIALVGGIYFVIARPDRALKAHLHDELEPTAAERE
ncbi:MAG TPA: APC family permease [Oryzihumus sp.]|nr:APC family permease [Oryzihumus sp.]